MTTNPEITNTRKKWLIRGGVAAVVVVLIVGAAVMFVPKLFQNTITAYFPATTGLYSGDDVRVLGVKVGTIDSIEPGADFARVTMNVKKSVEIPADAKAVIVAPSLVSGRFVQLTPVYAGGPTMGDGASIPVERTAVPVEWDEIKTELNKLSEALGPQGADPQGSLGTFIDTAADNLDGNGESLRNTLRELSETMRTCPTAGPTCSPPSATCRRSWRLSRRATNRSSSSRAGSRPCRTCLPPTPTNSEPP